MTLQDIRNSLGDSTPPAGLSPLLLALWHDARGDWNRAHDLAQDVETPEGSWVHAYLHRKEGDLWNADYWYRRAGRKRPPFSLEREWAVLVEELLKVEG